ncbi:multidrug resistance-associated ABC transporter [Marasmius fiardii PR-910]|nr:multidrug resistance-associated ABC transporter [Marasmius fiardii PR-910]
MGISLCGPSASGPFEFSSECVRDSWTSVVPVAFVVGLLLVSIFNARTTGFGKWVKGPFGRFLTLQEAESLASDGKEDGGRTTAADGSPDFNFKIWKAIVLVFVGLAEVICWTVVGSYTFILDDALTTTTENIWKGIRPLLLASAWTYTVVRPITRPPKTVPLDLFTLYVILLISGVVQFGGILYGHGVLGYPKPSTVEVVGYSLNLGGVLACLGVVLSMRLAVPSSGIKWADIGKSISPEDYTTLYGWISFSWVYPLVSLGKRSTLNESDVWNLSPTFQSRPVFEKFYGTTTDLSGKRRTLLMRIWKANSLDLLLEMVLTMMSSCLSYLNPFFLKRVPFDFFSHILSSIDKDAALVTPRDRSNAYIYACLMFLSSLAKAETDVQHLWFGRRAATRIRSELMASIYDKALKRKDIAGGGAEKSKPTDTTNVNAGNGKVKKGKKAKGKGKEEDNEPKAGADVGKIVNLMGGDANIVAQACTGMYLIYGSPLEIVLGCTYLYQLLGWSAFAGFAVILAGWPLNTLLARRSIRIQKGTMAARDKRMGVLNELVGAVKFIKFFAWEDRWIKRAMGVREKEIRWMIKARINSVLFYTLWMSAPILVSIVSFATYVLQGNELTVSKAFTAVALFGMIRAPLNVIPTWIVQILNTKVALDRIAVFLGEDEVDERVSMLKASAVAASASPYHQHSQRSESFLSGGDDQPAGGLGLRNATLKWNELEPKKDSDSSENQKAKISSWYGSLKTRTIHFRRWNSKTRIDEDGARGVEGGDSGDGGRDGTTGDTNGASASTETVQTDAVVPEDHRFELRDVTVMFPEGELTVVTGPTASGKTALLMAVLGEMTLLSGELVLNKTTHPTTISGEEGKHTSLISYASQTPWLRHQTIRENILFGYPYDPERYADVVEACALRPDFEVLEDGDETEIGSRGVSLSGGQKARVALARAVYARTRYVLLDDPLSAVDSHTSRYLYENLLCGPLLRGRTVVLVTHHVDLVLPGAYYLVRMLDGRIDTQGTVRELRERGLLDGIKEDAGVEAHRSDVAAAAASSGEEEDVKVKEVKAVEGELAGKKVARKLVKEEHRETGSVKWKIYRKYLEASSYYIWVFLAVFVVLNQFLAVGEKLWMMQWGKAYRDDSEVEAAVSTLTSNLTSTLTSALRFFPVGIPSFRPMEHEYAVESFNLYSISQHHVPVQQALLVNGFSFAANGTRSTITTGALGLGGAASSGGGLFGIHWPSAHEHPLFYVGIYAAIGLGNVLVNLCSVVAQYTGALRASRALFKQLLEKVVRATFRFHDTTPQGRMLNRFGKDIETIDSTLAGSLQAVNSSLASFFASVITITVVFPFFLLPAAVFGFVYRELAIAYLNTGRDLRRMESNSRSPIFSHFGELLEGIVTVRAFSAERQFLDGLHRKIDFTTKMWYGFWMTNRWLLLNFDCIGCLAVFITALFSISRTDDAAAGIAGLCISSALSFTGSVYWACRFWTNLELDLNSVERIVEYLEVPQEPPAIIESNRPPAYWPSANANNDALIRVENLSVKYAPDLPDVLQDVSFTLRAGERVGLLGRTGSGKSTLAMSVLRFVDPSSGRILIDGIDISTIGTYDLRSRLTFIPQDATLFSGTLRDNLDPFNEHTDEECLDVLYRVQIIQPGHEGGSRRSSRAPSTAASPTTSRPPSIHGGRDDTPTRTIASEDSFSTTTTDVENRSSSTISLSTEVVSGGTNFSQGQRQLISLARALLRRSSVIVLDEATSSIDFATDEKIQKAIREEFGQSLLLTVAHRLRTVIDYDRLIVLDKGRMMEFDSPLNLIRKHEGIFRNMCLKSGSFAELEAAAVAKAERDSRIPGGSQ